MDEKLGGLADDVRIESLHVYKTENQSAGQLPVSPDAHSLGHIRKASALS